MGYLTHLKALQALEAAIRRGSLKDAAEELGVTPAAIGQRIRGLEAYLGYPLLHRGRHGIAPTPALNEALGDLGKGFHHLQQAAKTLRLDSLNLIKVAADPDWASLWLRPRLEDFARQHPLIEIAVSETGRGETGAGSADFEIRFGNPSDATDQDVLFHDYLAPVSSPENHKRIAKLPMKRRLEGFPLLHLEPPKGPPDWFGWPQWVKRFGHRIKGADRGIRYQRAEHGLRAVRSDAGILICGLALVVDAVEAGQLSLPFETEKGVWTEQAYCLLRRPEVLHRPQAKKFHDWLLDRSADTRRRLENLCGARTTVV